MKHLILTLLFAFPLFATLTNAQESNKEWAFVNQKNGYGLFLKQGKKLTVNWHNKDGLQISMGKLMDMTEDSLVIVSKKGKIESIAKKDIDRLKFRKADTSGPRILGCFLIVVGILLAGLILLIQFVFDATRIDYQLANGERTIVWPWAFLGLLVLTLGIVKLKSSSIKISKPFGKEWVVQKLSVIPNNMP